MALINGDCTLNEVKARLKEQATYESTNTISFTSATKTIADTAYGFRAFETGDIVQVSGTTNNNGYFNIATGNTAGSIVTTEAQTNESASTGVTVTITKVIDKTNDVLLEVAIEAASRHIDHLTGDFFHSSTGTYYFTPDMTDMLNLCPSLQVVTTLKSDEDGDRTYENTWATTDYDLMPFNASNLSKPYSWIEVNPEGDYSFPKSIKSIELAGTWGWSAVPKPIKEACIMLSSRIMLRDRAPLGVAGTGAAGELTNIMVEDPDVMRLIAPYRKLI